jgi:hypothetical protein
VTGRSRPDPEPSAREPVAREPDVRRRPPGTARLEASSPADLLGVVPYLLGFHPEESVVTVLLGEREIVMTARIDAAALREPVELARYLDQVRCGQGALGLVTITYSRDPLARDRTAELAAQLGPLVLADALLADGERWWSVLCDGPCCPPEGTPYDAGSNSLSAAAVFAGMTALPDRAAVQALVAGPPPKDEPRLSELVDDALQAAIDSSVDARKRLVRRLVDDAVGGPPLSDVDSIGMAVLVHDLEVRDVAWAQLSRERAEDHVALWQQVVARTPPWLASAPLCLLGMAAWVAGNGALQNCCLERMDRIDPTYTMADLLADINRRALPPHYWDELLREFRRHPEMLAGQQRIGC